jgi:hypothetical protein
MWLRFSLREFYKSAKNSIEYYDSPRAIVSTIYRVEQIHRYGSSFESHVEFWPELGYLQGFNIRIFLEEF